MKRVIYIHQYFLTPEQGGAIRSYHLAKGMVEAGIEVEMITAHNSPDYDYRVIEGIKVHYLPVRYEHEFGFLKRSFAFLKFVRESKKLIKKIPRPDLLYITSTPLTTGIIGLWAKRKFALPYIFEVRDLWPEAPIQVGVIRQAWVKKSLYRLEEKIYQHALKIVALSPGIKNHIKLKAHQTPVYLVPNFSDTNFFTPTGKSKALLDKFGLKPVFTITYTGALGRVNALQDLLGLAKSSQKMGYSCQFVIMGKGALEKELKAKSSNEGLDNVKFISFGNKQKVKEILSLSDMAYISFEHLPVLKTNSPNKFFDALAMGLPVLVNHKGWVYDLVSKNGVGLFADPAVPEKAIKSMQSFIQSPGQLQEMQKKARELAVHYFDKETAIMKTLHILDPASFKPGFKDEVYILIA
ncbi:glycosyltransferase family 4 protein [Pararhodonellum marinum]|uniref:glycosyltransferase family 4 protein n=1 Tax=Pararhodonellum marinum TaxID=2755358 RepID=UPI00188DDC65|nr:glycosyltransferase family 4 protein [Pararhodonellum marinum]